MRIRWRSPRLDLHHMAVAQLEVDAAELAERISPAAS
jgi:hypothetical protein